MITKEVPSFEAQWIENDTDYSLLRKNKIGGIKKNYRIYEILE